MAEVCRVGRPPAVCSPVARFEILSDTPASFHDVLPLPLAAGPARPLAYQVRVVNAAGRGAVATTVRTLAGAAPPPLLELRAEPVNGGVALRWQRDASAADRVLIHVTRGEPKIEAPNRTSRQSGTLLAVEPSGKDAGGALDPGAHPGTAQVYSVERVRTIHVGTEDLTASSVPASVAVSADAKAAPLPAPADLEAVANTLAAPVIDLSWSPVPGAATYLVYRAEGTEQPRLLSSEAISGLSYSDGSVRLGVQYRYSVATVDAQGTQSVRSPQVTAALPQP